LKSDFAKALADLRSDSSAMREVLLSEPSSFIKGICELLVTKDGTMVRLYFRFSYRPCADYCSHFHRKREHGKFLIVEAYGSGEKETTV